LKRDVASRFDTIHHLRPVFLVFLLLTIYIARTCKSAFLPWVRYSWYSCSERLKIAHFPLAFSSYLLSRKMMGRLVIDTLVRWSWPWPATARVHVGSVLSRQGVSHLRVWGAPCFHPWSIICTAGSRWGWAKRNRQAPHRAGIQREFVEHVEQVTEHRVLLEKGTLRIP
jgi:hypothetical protein